MEIALTNRRTGIPVAGQVFGYSANCTARVLLRLVDRGRASSSPPGRLTLVVGAMWRPREAVVNQTEIVRADNWFDCMAIRHLSKSIQATTGIGSKKEGYESLVEVTSAVAETFTPREQQDLVIEALQRAFPEFIISLAKTLMHPHKLTRECFAVFTTIFFPWLVGPCKVKESDFDGRKEKNTVHIKKCRFLESTNCAGMCINMCKIPTQKFIIEALGMPVYMVPGLEHLTFHFEGYKSNHLAKSAKLFLDFDDMSCELIFGQHPPKPEDDPALKQPCFKALCKTRQQHAVDCPGGTDPAVPLAKPVP